eukprot:TRINITY_DN1632_c0_g1_i14.p1 TRINITY_DN1632_c0_g1~~TRINITY_DN1632_c0_g1_i14.p1  ORF type:complete len:106 (+),score=12.60 TRINITY_DN1632_c0_g1_i14:719-1036(+)
MVGYKDCNHIIASFNKLSTIRSPSFETRTAVHGIPNITPWSTTPSILSKLSATCARSRMGDVNMTSSTLCPSLVTRGKSPPVGPACPIVGLLQTLKVIGKKEKRP